MIRKLLKWLLGVRRTKSKTRVVKLSATVDTDMI